MIVINAYFYEQKLLKNILIHFLSFIKYLKLKMIFKLSLDFHIYCMIKRSIIGICSIFTELSHLKSETAEVLLVLIDAEIK